jgi:hypothetical protein
VGEKQGKEDEVKEILWRLFAWFVSRKRVADWLIARAQRTPYTHLPGYMERYWLFNAYRKCDGKEVTPISWLPSVRIHRILREDQDRHMHDHPWDARTVILRGWYIEERQHAAFLFKRSVGDTTPIRFGEYHSITRVSTGGVWTMFITFGYQGTWGFKVDGVKVPWREYMARYPKKAWAQDDREAAR